MKPIDPNDLFSIQNISKRQQEMNELLKRAKASVALMKHSVIKVYS